MKLQNTQVRRLATVFALVAVVLAVAPVAQAKPELVLDGDTVTRQTIPYLSQAGSSTAVPAGAQADRKFVAGVTDFGRDVVLTKREDHADIADRRAPSASPSRTPVATQAPSGGGIDWTLVGASSAITVLLAGGMLIVARSRRVAL